MSVSVVSKWLVCSGRELTCVLVHCPVDILESFARAHARWQWMSAIVEDFPTT